MKRNVVKAFIKTVCMILCICILLPMFSACFRRSDKEQDNGGSITENNGSGGSNQGGSNAGGSDDDSTGSGETETTYYKVGFAVAIEEYKNRVTLPEEKLYKEGTEIQYLPTPAVRDMLFMGWYYDAAMTKPVSLTDKVNSDLLLYAKVVDTSEDISVVEGVYYHTAYDVDTDYTFAVKADSLESAALYVSIVNISSAGASLVYGADYSMSDNGDGTFKVSVSYKAGKTYRVNVERDHGIAFVVDGVALSEQVTTLNVLVAKAEVSNLTLSDGLIYIPMADVVMMTETPNGLVTLTDGGASVNSNSIGFFTYDGATLKSGDKVAIYEGDIPSARDFGTDNGAVKYLTVTGVMQNNVYKFRVSDTKEVLFIPDIIPVSGKTNFECETRIAISTLDFGGSFYQQLGMNEDTRLEAGDYLAFFDGPMADGTPVEYVRVTDVQRDDSYYYVNYTPVSYDDVIASMDIFQTRTNTPELSDEQTAEIVKQVYSDAINSGFVEEAADYLVNLYVSTSGLAAMPDGTTVRYTPKMRSYARSGGSGLYYEITKCEAEPDIKIGEGVLKHFEESDGIRVELVLSFEVEFTLGEDGENKVVIAAEAVFEEEVLLTINVDGGAVWEMAWIFPYIVDYEMNANIDIGTYTGVSVVAKVYTSNGEEKEEEDDDDSFFPDFDLDNIGKGDSYEEKAKNIGEELKKLFELNDNIKEEVEGEEEDDTGNDITEKYAEMMKDANEAWIEIVKADIYEYSINLDQFGILWFSMDVDFVISAQLYIMAGIEVETGVAKRYNFSVTLFERSVKTDVIDLEKAHFTFKFYCMGTAGLKVGFELEMSLALLSSDVASVGISAELGVSLGIWGYFYYSYEKEAGEEPEVQKAGAMFFELGIYIEVKFKAHLFNIEKLTYNPTLYENLWPLYSVGTQENVFEFEDYEDAELVFVMQGTNTIVLPDYIFRMKYLDLKDGKYYSGTDDGDETPSKTFDDETESRFLIEILDDRFTYDPGTNTLTTTVDVRNMDVNDSFEITIRITYKHGALAFNQEVISREITVQVKNNAEYGYIYVSLNGPATLNAEGPGGNSSYHVRHGDPFTVDMLPEYDVVKGYKFVKWIWLQNYRDVNGKLWQEGDEFVGLDSVERKTYLYLTAVWEPQSVEHTVRILKEVDGGAYVYDRTETVTGLVGSRYELYNLADAGYTVRTGDSQRIYLEYNGTYDLYLERATRTIRFLDVDGDGGMISTTAKCGSALVPPVVSSKLGYEFAGWAEGTSGKVACEMPENVPFVNGVIVYTALWTPVYDVPFTVKHYVQNANDDGFELYMTEYLNGYYDQPIKAADYRSDAMWDDGYQWVLEINPGYLNTVRVALDGSTVIRIYYERMRYAVRDGIKSYGSFRHGQTVDLTTFENIPEKSGYRFVGWDVDGDGVKDDTFVMPKDIMVMTPLWEGVDGTQYKVIHMVESAYTDNYIQAGFSYMYGVTGATPAVESIYDAKYIADGQFEANYELARVATITNDNRAVMYAYYDRVEHNVIVKATDPESGRLIKETAVSIPYGKAIHESYFPSLSEFDVEGYVASRYSSSGYDMMPDHDVTVEVVYSAVTATPFVINHYKERADGTFFLYSTTTEYGRTGLALHKAYRQLRLTELDGNGSHFSLSTDMLEEAYVARDGSTVYDLYYVRDKVKMSVYIYKLDADGNQLSIFADETLTEYYRYGERVIFHGYYDHYEFVKMVDSDTDEVYYGYYTIEKNTVAKIYVKPESGVPYTVTHWVENLDGTGYEVYATGSYTGTHSVAVSAERYVKSISGFTVDASLLESVVLDGDKENSLNIYYKRNVYNVKFYNSYKTEASVSYDVRYGAAVPTPPSDVAVAGYDFAGWENYTEGSTVLGNIEFRAAYALSSNTPYKVNHYVMDLNGGYQLVSADNRTGYTNSTVVAADHLLKDYVGNGYTLRENTSERIAPDGSTVLNVYYDRESFRFSYHYYVGGKAVSSIGVLVMHGAPIPDSIYDYVKDYPEYELEGYAVLKNGEYVAISELPTAMGSENIEIRVILKAIGPEVTVVHKVMNTDGETYEEIREEFLAIPFEELDLADHLLAAVMEGFTYRIPVNNQIPDALKENVYEIYYDRNTYTVKYFNDYNFETVTESYLYGESLGTSPVFTRPGYTHIGWNAELPETMPARDVSFTSTWQIRDSVPVTIVHMMSALDGDGYVEKCRETVYHTPELMIYGSNYATGIAGGAYKNADKRIVSADGSTEVCVYYTRGEYTVRFTYGDIAGAGEDVVLKLPYESTITAPDFKVNGYVLVGWSPALPETVQAESVTYTAKWQAANAEITVKHWTEGLDGKNSVSATEKVSVSFGTQINGASYKKSLEGFTFADADKNVTVQPDGSTVVNVYYTRNSYKVTYTYGDKVGEAVVKTVKYGAALPAAPVFSVVGYTFVEWDSALAATMPASDLTYAARWTESTNTEFAVEHYYQNANDDGYTKVGSDKKHGTTGATVNGADYKRALDEAVFEWAECGTVNADGTTVIKVYYVRTAYTITFTYGNKSGEAQSYLLRYGQKVSYNPSFSVQGYVFAGWDKSIPDSMPAENVVINATWKAGDGVKYRVEHYLQNIYDDGYTLADTENRTGVTGALINGAELASMVSGGIKLKSADSLAIAADGSTVIKIYYDRESYRVTFTYGSLSGDGVTYTVRYGAALPEAPVFSAVGYTFVRWDSTLASTMPSSDLTYAAVWAANTDTEFVVEHYYQNANDDGYTKVGSDKKRGTTGAAVNGEDHKKALEEAIFEWAERGTVNADGTTVIKVYYVRTTYTVTFNYGFVSDEAVVDDAVRFGETITAPVFSTAGYTFLGWLDEEGLPVDVERTMPARDLVYTAFWAENEDTPFTVEHYVEEANGTGYEHILTETHTGRTGSEIVDIYLYMLNEYDDGVKYAFERVGNENFVILPDGNAVLKIYYQRVRYTVTFVIVNQNMDSIGGAEPIVNTDVKYGQTITTPKAPSVYGYAFDRFELTEEVMPHEDIECYIYMQCLHLNNNTHICNECSESLECVDNNDDGHCDYGREPFGSEEHRYVDVDGDHRCDICRGDFSDLCYDNDKNGKCDVCDMATLCPETGEEHADDDRDHVCDDCHVWMSYVCESYIIDGKHECDICYARFYDMCTDSDEDCRCDYCWESIPCVDKDGDRVCDVCGGDMPCTGHVDENDNSVCDYCKMEMSCTKGDGGHYDDNHDHYCDACGGWLSYLCGLGNDYGRCSECGRPTFCDGDLEVEHVDGEDGDADHYCDNCGFLMSFVCVDDGFGSCCLCGNEIRCWDHVDVDKNALCDVCGEETKCKKNPYDTYHCDDDGDHTCDFEGCEVWISSWCYDDDFDGYCDECPRVFVVADCTHEEVEYHVCMICHQRVTECFDDDGDMWCDDCWEYVECQHVGMDGNHMCRICYEYLSDCVDEDGDEMCDLTPENPHFIWERN